MKVQKLIQPKYVYRFMYLYFLSKEESKSELF